MKVESKCLFINVKNEVELGNGSIKLTAIHQIIVSGDEGKICADVEFIDHENFTFLGMSIDGYDAFKSFKSKMIEMGVDVEKMMDDACDGIIPDEFVEKCKVEFLKMNGL